MLSLVLEYIEYNTDTEQSTAVVSSSELVAGQVATDIKHQNVCREVCLAGGWTSQDWNNVHQVN